MENVSALLNQSTFLGLSVIQASVTDLKMLETFFKLTFAEMLGSVYFIKYSKKIFTCSAKISFAYEV